MKKSSLTIIAFAFVLFSACIVKAELNELSNAELRVLFEPSLRLAAQELIEIYPDAKAEIEKTFGWELEIRPWVFLIKDRTHFGHMENPLIIAFADPDRDLIVIDHSKLAQKPLTLKSTLKHELCHLLLHHHINNTNLPRWLDEGVCQWSSDWIWDIAMDQRQSYLNRAALKQMLFSLKSLTYSFPAGKEGMGLAYEQSKDFVAYIISRFGKEGILNLLNRMKRGEDTDRAFVNSLNMPLEELEGKWHDSLKKRVSWFMLISYNLYEILFSLSAIVCIYGAIRIMIKKRSLMDEDVDDHILSP